MAKEDTEAEMNSRKRKLVKQRLMLAAECWNNASVLLFVSLDDRLVSYVSFPNAK